MTEINASVNKNSITNQSPAVTNIGAAAAKTMHGTAIFRFLVSFFAFNSSTVHSKEIIDIAILIQRGNILLNINASIATIIPTAPDKILTLIDVDLSFSIFFYCVRPRQTCGALFHILKELRLAYLL